MLLPRKSFLGTLAGFLFLFILERVAKPVLDVEIQDFWKDSAHPLIRDRAWSWGPTMLDWIGPFWAGIGCAFTAMFVVEIALAWSRRGSKRRPQVLDLTQTVFGAFAP